METRCANCPFPEYACIGEQVLCKVDKAVLKTQILSVLKDLYKKDLYLLEVQANEVCISTHFWYYFKQRYDSVYTHMNIDPEYNRNGIDPKEYYVLTGEVCHYAKPDMIIHKRGCNRHNFAYFEFKTRETNIDHDYEKLKAFTSFKETNRDLSKYIYKYQYGISVFLNSQCVVLKWFEDGAEKETEIYYVARTIGG